MKRSSLLCTSLLIVMFANAQTSLNQGLMAWYPFNGNANDSSGNGNNPSFNNAKLTTDRFGRPNGAYEFDGTTSYMQIPNSASLNTTNKLSYSVWVKVNVYYKGACHGNVILSKGIATATGIYDLFLDDGPFSNFQNCNVSQVDTVHESFYSAGVITKSPFIEKNIWYHVVYTNDGDSARMYIGGKLIGTAYSPQTFTNTSDLVFGKNYQPNIYWLNGALDDIRIYNKVLSAAEVDSLYNYQPKADLNLGLMAWYPFDGNDKDTSGNHNDPTFDNAKLTTDRFGNANSACEFDGASGYIKIPNSASLNTNNQLTISLWTKVNGYNLGQCGGNFLLSKGTEATPGVYEVVLGVAPYGKYKNIDFCSNPIDTAHEIFEGGGLVSYNDSTPTIGKDQWYHVVFLYKGDTSYIYLNGKLASVGYVPKTFTDAADLYLGRYDISSSLPYFFKGALDDIRIYNRPLSKGEIDSLYNYKQKPDLNLGLIAWYPFDGNDKDSSGNKNNPTFDNAKLTTDRFGKANSAYSFDGASTFMHVPNSSTLNAGTQLTMSLWVKPKTFYKGQCVGNYAIAKGSQSQQGVYDVVFGNAPYGIAKNIDFCNTAVDTSHESFYGAGIGSIDSASTYLSTNKWYHVVMIYDGTKSYMYVNDKLTSIGIAATTFTNTADLYIGAYQNLTYWLNGDLDDTRIYNRAISKIEVDSLYGNPSTILPITLQSFTAKAITLHYTSIQIATTNETNAASIDIEKSYDGINFAKTGSLTAKGNVVTNQYSFTDKADPAAAVAYYRLKLINKDGTYQYSTIISVQLLVTNNQISIYPNPAQKFIMVNGKNIKQVNILDNLGRVMVTKKGLSNTSSLNKIEFNLN